MKAWIIALVYSSFLAAGAVAVRAQSPVATMRIGDEEIGTVRTAQGITTRISFSEEVTEIICGDLYDPASGKGSFVVQRSGNDVFVKPIASKGMSNLFVKTGPGGKRTWNFDLLIVSAAQAHRVVNVALPLPKAEREEVPREGDAASGSPAPMPPKTAADSPPGNADLERRRAEIEQAARQEAESILRNARQQAGRLVTEAEAKVSAAEKDGEERAAREAQNRFVHWLMLGIRETKIAKPRVVVKRIIISVDPQVLTFDEKAYLHYTIQNTGDKDFTFASLLLETGSGSSRQPVSIEVVQNKPENQVASGETIAGVIVFDPKVLASKEGLRLRIRGEGDADVAQLIIQ